MNALQTLVEWAVPHGIEHEEAWLLYCALRRADGFEIDPYEYEAFCESWEEVW